MGEIADKMSKPSREDAAKSAVAVSVHHGNKLHCIATRFFLGEVKQSKGTVTDMKQSKNTVMDVTVLLLCFTRAFCSYCTNNYHFSPKQHTFEIRHFVT